MHKKTTIWALLLLTLHGFAQSPVPAGEEMILEQLAAFMPGSSLKAAEDVHGKGKKSAGSAEDISKRFYHIAKNGYAFSLWVQVRQDAAIDFYAKLPSYLPHGRFHQALVERYGQQDQYFRQETSAVYRWNDEENKQIIYEGQCSLTCFPLYLAVSPVSKPEGAEGYKPIFETLLNNEAVP